MRSIRSMVAMILGLVVGIAATWVVLHHGVNPTGSALPAPTTAPAGVQVLYWYDPMSPDKHFDKPGKSPFMDMQLVPRYANAAGESPGTVNVDARAVQNLGVRIVRAERGVLDSSVIATGSVAFDERAVTTVQARVAGIVERLDVRAPLTPVKQGQALLTLLAPDWTAAQEEFLSLRRSSARGLDDLLAASRQRLLLIGMDEAQIRAIEHGGKAQSRFTVTAPRAGVIGELSVRDGASVVAGSPLMQINGLDTVWINAAVPEAQIARVAPSSPVEAIVPAFPGERFSGQVEALLADIDAATRTQTARIALRNPGHRLVPGMYARVEIATANASASVLLPSDAVIATGTRNVVIVDDGQGRFRAQEVRIGDEANGKTQIVDGISEGERVVLSGQFLIDSEASLSGTLTRLEGAGAARDAPARPAGSKP
ncbi:MAG TPA: efflux RND transporter periplasmic adaptor subunit [Rudaea sp.]|nr:efflux RND transporter periplasmic adaptor subunit [Rudaea sp.]